MNITDDGVSVSGGDGNGGPPLRVLIADDDPFARRVIRDALQAAGVMVVGEADDGTEAVELALRLRPDVVLMDVLMPGTDRSRPPAGSAIAPRRCGSSCCR